MARAFGLKEMQDMMQASVNSVVRESVRKGIEWVLEEQLVHVQGYLYLFKHEASSTYWETGSNYTNRLARCVESFCTHSRTLSWG